MKTPPFLALVDRELADVFLICHISNDLKEIGAHMDEKVVKALKRTLKYYLTASEYESFKMWLKEK